MGPGFGLVGAVWSVFVRGVRWKQVSYFQVVRGLGVKLDDTVFSQRGELATMTLICTRGATVSLMLV